MKDNFIVWLFVRAAHWPIFGSVSEIAKIDYYVHVRPSASMELLDSHLSDFHEICYYNVFRKYVEQIQISLKFDKNNGYFKCRPLYIYDHILLRYS
jgi:hypothetical protein